MDSIDKRMFLKKRYCMQQQQIEELRARKKANDEDYKAKLLRGKKNEKLM
jgi:hypothetical protein